MFKVFKLYSFLKIGCKGTNFYLRMQVFVVKKHSILHRQGICVHDFGLFYLLSSRRKG